MSIEKEENNLDAKLDRLLKQGTETEMAVFLLKHIENPCSVEIEPGKPENIRKFYIRIARDLLEKMNNPHAKRLLEMKIKEFDKT